MSRFSQLRTGGTYKRFLTNEWVKERVVLLWEEKKRSLSRPEGDPGGHGYVDPEIVAFCDAINEQLPGIVTLQSCCGHRLRSAVDGAEYTEHAHLWLWASRSVSAALHNVAPNLARQPWVESVRWLFLKDGRQIFDLRFHGCECGADVFAHSCDRLLTELHEATLEAIYLTT